MVRVGDGIRTRDIQIHNLVPELCKAGEDKGLRSKAPALAHHLPTDARQTDPILAEVVEHWNNLPEAIREGILAMIRASRKV